MLSPFLFGLATFTTILLIAKILKLVELVVSRGVSLASIVALFSYALPTFLELCLPMALLFSIMAAFCRMAADSEITALKSSGISLLQMAMPAAAFALVIFLLALLCSLFGRPWGNHKLRQKLYEIAKQRATAGLQERVFNNDFGDYVIYAEQIEPPGNVLKGVLIADLKRHETIIASRGVIIADERHRSVTLHLEGGTVHSFTPSSSRPYEHKDYQKTKFTEADYTLNFEKLAQAFDRGQLWEKDPKEMTLAELLSRIREKEGQGKVAVAERLELHHRLAIPAASLVFALLAVPLGLRRTRSAVSRSFAVSLGTIFCYYLLLSAGRALGSRAVIEPWLALWLPNLVLTPVGLLVLFRASRELSFQATGRWLTKKVARALPLPAGGGKL